MTHRRYQYGAAAGTLLLAVAATVCVYRGMHVVAVVFGVGVLVLLEAAARETRRLRRARTECDWARRRALGENPAPLKPCCLLGAASHGQVHRNCTDPTRTSLTRDTP
ncbi:hypothetical protein [Streptomyces sp. NBC_00620]|uniref:hypothetical protein n=1 Tax=Streptomyces sp. NBC_00620 TaxID=2903666 RepID=UPI002254A914|nr:hypothetical protein [Streptomyces sp. NBC_00620]MCX4974258.1 hypothetical protein [Streptomyces sp. NBC_00620]